MKRIDLVHYVVRIIRQSDPSINPLTTARGNSCFNSNRPRAISIGRQDRDALSVMDADWTSGQTSSARLTAIG